MKRSNLLVSNFFVGLSLLLLSGFLSYWLYDRYQTEYKSLCNEVSLASLDSIFGSMNIDISRFIGNLEEDIKTSSDFQIAVSFDDFSEESLDNMSVRRNFNFEDTLRETIISAVISTDTNSFKGTSRKIHSGRYDSLLLKDQLLMIGSEQSPIQIDKAAIRRKVLINLLPQFLFSLFLFGITLGAILLLQRNFREKQVLLESKNNFINNMTHELKTPIATIQVALEAIQDFNIIEDRTKTEAYLRSSRKELDRLALLVDQVLKISELEDGKQFYHFEKLDLILLIQSVIDSQKLSIEQHKAQIEIQSSKEKSYQIQGDQMHLKNVIFNLLSNALKYSDKGENIVFKIEALVDKIRCTVQDNGHGIPVEYQSRVFEKFFRVPKGDLHSTKGYGLGLSYVAKVIDSHHATIGLESEEGKGTSIILTFTKG